MQIDTQYDDRTSTLTHVVWDEATRDAVVIDPVLDFDPASGRVWTESLDRVLATVRQQQLRVHWVLETHAHADHLSGSQGLVRDCGAKLAVGGNITSVQQVFREVFGLGAMPVDGRQFDRLLRDGEVLEAGALRVTALATPGHTAACLSFLAQDAVFTGDTLFHEDVGVGRCDFPGGSADQLFTSVTERLYRLPDATRVFPGHDYPSGRPWRPSTTIAAEKKGNVQLSAATHRQDFIDRRTARDRGLSAPRLLYPSLQVNIAGGRLPEAGPNGRRYLLTPVSGL